MKNTSWLAILLAAGILTPSCAQLEDHYDNDWGTRKHHANDQEAQAQDASNDEASPATHSEGTTDADPVGEDLDYHRTSKAIPTGKASTSALLLTKSLPKEVWRGVEFTYTLGVENLTQDDLDNVFVEERLPASLQALDADPAPLSSEGGKMVWSLGSLASGAEQTITVRAKAIEDGLSESFATASYESALQGEVRVVSPNINLSMSGPDTVSPGDTFDLNFTLTNSGTGSARNVAVVAKLPEGMETLDGTREATLQVPSLDAGQSRTLTLQAKATQAGEFSATAEANMQGGSSILASSAPIRAQETRLALSSKTSSKFFLGNPGKVEYTVKNVGQTIAADVHLRQPLPDGVEIVRSSVPAEQADGVATYSLGDLAVGETKVVTVNLMASEAGNLDLGATAKASKGPEAKAASSVSVEGLSALHFSVEDLQDPVPVGESLTYHVKVHNQGTAAGSNIAVSILLDDGMELVRAAGPTNGKADGNKITFQALDTLDADATATWRLVVKSRKVGDLRLKAEVTSNRLKTPVKVEESTHFYE